MACDVRIAAEAAVFGQPEIKLGIIPGFGGTQRLPRLVGANKALEMNLVGDAILAEEALEFGLVNRVVPDHELFETALMWGRKLAGQAPIAREQIKLVSDGADLDEGIEAEKGGFAAAFGSEDAKEGIAAFLGKRSARVDRQVADRGAERLAELVSGAEHGRGADRRRRLGAVGDPDFRTPETGLWAKVDPMEVAHIDVFERDPARFWSYLPAALPTLGDKQPNAAHEALAELERRGLLAGVITQNIDRLHRAAGSENWSRSTARSRPPPAGAAGLLRARGGRRAFRREGVARCAACRGPVKPGVVLFGELLPEEAMAGPRSWRPRADLMLCVG